MQVVRVVHHGVDSRLARCLAEIITIDFSGHNVHVGRGNVVSGTPVDVRRHMHQVSCGEVQIVQAIG